MKSAATLPVLRYAVAAALAALLLSTINIPAHALVADPRIGTPAELKPTPEATPSQLDKQMRGPKVKAPVGPAEPLHAPAVSPLPHGPEPDAVLAVMSGAKEHSPDHAAPPAKTRRSSTLLGLAITAALLGLICAAGMLIVRMGPKPPKAVARDEEE